MVLDRASQVLYKFRVLSRKSRGRIWNELALLPSMNNNTCTRNQKESRKSASYPPLTELWTKDNTPTSGHMPNLNGNENLHTKNGMIIYHCFTGIPNMFRCSSAWKSRDPKIDTD